MCSQATSPQDDMPEALPAGPKVERSATGLAKSAHDVTAASMEETLRLGHAAFQVGVERLGRCFNPDDYHGRHEQ